MPKARMKAGRKTQKTGKVQTPKVIRGARPLPPPAKAGPVVMNGISENDEFDDTNVVGAEDAVRHFFGEALE